MRICLVTSVPMPPEEGIGYYVWNLAQQLVRKGHSVQIITRGTLQRETFENQGGIGIWRPTFAPLYPFHVHIHSHFVNRLVANLEHQIDVFHVHTPLPPILITSRPILLTVHSSMRADTRSTPITDAYSLLIKLQLPVSYRLEHQLINSSTMVTAVAESVANDLLEYGIDPIKVKVLGNGVDHNFFVPDGTTSSDTPYIFAASRLGHGKGLEDLVECARIVCGKHPRVQFWIAGKGPLEARVEKAIRQLGLERRIRLLGHIIDRNKMVALYQQATAFVHPSHHEGFPTVLLEAMACAKPVITTAVGGVLDLIIPDENGVLVPSKQPKALAEAILFLLQNPTLCQCLGQKARQTVEKHYSWDVVSDHYLSCYQTIQHNLD